MVINEDNFSSEVAESRNIILESEVVRFSAS